MPGALEINVPMWSRMLRWVYRDGGYELDLEAAALSGWVD
jgi:hypothetical protein